MGQRTTPAVAEPRLVRGVTSFGLKKPQRANKMPVFEGYTELLMKLKLPENKLFKSKRGLQLSCYRVAQLLGDTGTGLSRQVLHAPSPRGNGLHPDSPTRRRRRSSWLFTPVESLTLGISWLCFAIHIHYILVYFYLHAIYTCLTYLKMLRSIST